MEYFGEDAVVSLGKYFWRRKYKVVFKKVAKRTRERIEKMVPTVRQTIQKRDPSDTKQGSLGTTAPMGAFVGANLDSVSQLNKEFKDKEQGLQKEKHDLALDVVHHRQEI